MNWFKFFYDNPSAFVVIITLFSNILLFIKSILPNKELKIVNKRLEEMLILWESKCALCQKKDKILEKRNSEIIKILNKV